MVEFALVLGAFLLLVFGVTQFGLAMNATNDETHLADEAARYAAVNYNPSTTAGQSLAAWIRAQADTSLSGGGSVCISFPSGTAQIGDPVKVVVTSGTIGWQPLPAIISVLKLADPGLPNTTSGSATMRLEAQPTTYGAGCA